MAGKAAKKAEKASASTAKLYFRIILAVTTATLIKGEKSWRTGAIQGNQRASDYTRLYPCIWTMMLTRCYLGTSCAMLC